MITEVAVLRAIARWGDIGLDVGDLVKISLHVIKKNCQNIGLKAVQILDLALKLLNGIVIVVAMQFEQIEANAPGKTDLVINLPQLAQRCKGFRGPGVGPVLTQDAIALGGIDIVLVIVLFEESGIVLAGFPGPEATKKTFNDAVVKLLRCVIHDFRLMQARQLSH